MNIHIAILETVHLKMSNKIVQVILMNLPSTLQLLAYRLTFKQVLSFTIFQKWEFRIMEIRIFQVKEMSYEGFDVLHEGNREIHN